MKSIKFGATILILASLGCENKTEKTSDSVQKTDSAKHSVVGNDKDEHGCIGSAGYTWSVIKNDCVKLWEAGTKLTSVTDTAEATYLIFNADQTKAEIYMPKANVVYLQRTGEEGNYIWTDGTYEVFSWKGYTLRKKGGEALYNGDSN